MPPEDAGSTLALGCNGDVSLELSMNADQCLELAVRLGTFSVDVLVASLELPRALVEFLAGTFRTSKYVDREVAPGRWAYCDRPRLLLGTAAGLEVILEKDGKYDDRYFILVGPGRSIEFAPSVEQTERLVAAATDLDEDSS